MVFHDEQNNCSWLCNDAIPPGWKITKCMRNKNLYSVTLKNNIIQQRQCSFPHCCLSHKTSYADMLPGYNASECFFLFKLLEHLQEPVMIHFAAKLLNLRRKPKPWLTSSVLTFLQSSLTWPSILIPRCCSSPIPTPTLLPRITSNWWAGHSSFTFFFMFGTEKLM